MKDVRVVNLAFHAEEERDGFDGRYVDPERAAAYVVVTMDDRFGLAGDIALSDVERSDLRELVGRIESRVWAMVFDGHGGE